MKTNNKDLLDRNEGQSLYLTQYLKEDLEGGIFLYTMYF